MGRSHKGQVITGARGQIAVRPSTPQVESSTAQELTDLATEGINAVNDAMREEFRDRYYGLKVKP